MSRDRAASSSDVERARELSRKLGPTLTPAVEPASSAPSPYIRFDAARFAGSVVAPAGAAPARSAVVIPALPPSEDWASLLAWVRLACSALEVFLIDGRGLLVASSGDISKERAESMGARLVLAFEQADRMEESASQSRSIVIDFGDVVLTGIRIPLPEGGTLVVGIAGKELPQNEARAEVERVLTRRARG